MLSLCFLKSLWWVKVRISVYLKKKKKVFSSSFLGLAVQGMNRTSFPKSWNLPLTKTMKRTAAKFTDAHSQLQSSSESQVLQPPNKSISFFYWLCIKHNICFKKSLSRSLLNTKQEKALVVLGKWHNNIFFLKRADLLELKHPSLAVYSINPKERKKKMQSLAI